MMEKKSHLLYVTLLGLFGILAIVALSLGDSSNLDAAMIWDKEPTPVYQKACTEVQDKLNLFDVKGAVDYKGYRYYDFCGGDKLFQVHCGVGPKVRLLGAYKCANGCSNGVCL